MKYRIYRLVDAKKGQVLYIGSEKLEKEEVLSKPIHLEWILRYLQEKVSDFSERTSGRIYAEGFVLNTDSAEYAEEIAERYVRAYQPIMQERDYNEHLIVPALTSADRIRWKPLGTFQNKEVQAENALYGAEAFADYFSSEFLEIARTIDKALAYDWVTAMQVRERLCLYLDDYYAGKELKECFSEKEIRKIGRASKFLASETTNISKMFACEYLKNRGDFDGERNQTDKAGT